MSFQGEDMPFISMNSKEGKVGKVGYRITGTKLPHLVRGKDAYVCLPDVRDLMICTLPRLNNWIVVKIFADMCSDPVDATGDRKHHNDTFYIIGDDGNDRDESSVPFVQSITEEAHDRIWGVYPPDVEQLFWYLNPFAYMNSHFRDIKAVRMKCRWAYPMRVSKKDLFKIWSLSYPDCLIEHLNVGGVPIDGDFDYQLHGERISVRSSKDNSLIIEAGKGKVRVEDYALPFELKGWHVFAKSRNLVDL